MESFRCNSNFETGLKKVDDQHHRLVDIINVFGNHLTLGEYDTERFENIFRELADYAGYHFSEEETLMARTGIDERHIKSHKNEHKNFLEEIQSLHRGFSPEENGVLKLLLDFLINWLAYHMLGADQKMARQIHGVQSGISPEAVYIKDEDANANRASEPLVNALTRLFDLLTYRNRQLEELNQSLEEKVSERTREISDANRRLEELALTDSLTGLYNRRYAVRALQTIWDEATISGFGLSCLMIDADHFKDVNDNWGHDAGDIVLKELSRAIKYSLRTDDIPCRLGGDEFFVICPQTNLDGAVLVAETVLKAVNGLKIPTGESTWNGSASIGVAGRTSEMTLHDELIKTADDGVYLAKNYGRNCVKTIQLTL